MPWPGLRGAWEQRQRLHVRGRRFEYRVTPKVVQQGQWEIAQVERRRRGCSPVPSWPGPYLTTA